MSKKLPIKQLMPDSVLILQDEPIRKTKSGLVIPDSIKKGVPMPKRGKVLMSTIGEIKAGDYVRFKPYTPTIIEQGKKKYGILKKDHIIAKERE